MKTKMRNGELVLEIAHRAIVAISASSAARAHAIVSQPWFLEELVRYRSQATPLWDGVAEVVIRETNCDELAELEVARLRERKSGEYDGMVFTFLIPVDPDPN
jgi:hypothetical protein